jgi:hypothetical protein
MRYDNEYGVDKGFEGGGRGLLVGINRYIPGEAGEVTQCFSQSICQPG